MPATETKTPAAPTAGELERILITNQRQYSALETLVHELATAVKNGSEEAKQRMADLQQQVTILSGPEGRKPVPSTGLSKKDLAKFSFLKTIRGIHQKDWRGAEYEKEILDLGGQCRAQSAGTDTAGGYWLPPEFSADFIELLRPALVLEQAGATIETGISGSPYEISGQAGGATAVMIGENSSITESQLSAKLLKATPHMVGAFVLAPLGFIQRANNPNAEQKIRADMAAALARKMELEILQGTGAGPSLLGLQKQITESALDTTAGSAQAPRWQNFVRLRGKVMDQNVMSLVDQRSAAFISTDKGIRAFLLQGVAEYSTATEVGQTPVYGNPIFTANELSTRIGTKVLTTNQLAELATNNPPLWFGLWSELIIPIWGQIALAVSDQAGNAFQNVQLAFRATAEFDYVPRYKEAFAWARVDASAA